MAPPAADSERPASPAPTRRDIAVLAVVDSAAAGAFAARLREVCADVLHRCTPLDAADLARVRSATHWVTYLADGDHATEAWLTEVLGQPDRPPVLVVAEQARADQGGRLLLAGAEDYRGDSELHGDALSLAVSLLTARVRPRMPARRAPDAVVSDGEVRLRLALEASNTGIWEWDPLTGSVWWSPEAYTIHGLTRDEFDGRAETFWSLVHPDDLRRVQDTVTQAYEARAVYRADFRIRRKDGGVRWVSNFGRVVDVPGGPARMLGTISDVTEQTVAAERLRESEERFRLMADQTPIILWVTDPQGGNEFVNRAYRAFFGVTPENVYDGRWHALVHPDDGAYVETVRHATAARTGFTAEARVRAASGEWRWILSTAVPRYAASGEFLGLIGATEDITDVKRAAVLEQQAARQKDSFIAVLAHELRNPLAPIRTAVGVLSSRQTSDPVVARCHGIIERQATQMARLLDDLLDASRLSRGTLTLARRLVRIADVMERAIETSRPALDDRAQPLDLRLAADVWLFADPDRLTQVFSNLLNNASKYSAPGAAIVVDVEADGPWVHTHVRDTGIGMTPEVLARVFDLFVQADDAQQHAPGGLGIGLSLARMLVELHGGTITADSKGTGRGSVFSVRLPSMAGDVATIDLEHESSLEVRDSLQGRRVLVVDDNMDAAEMIAALLAQAGGVVQAVRSGAEALEASVRFMPEVVLLDLGMPNMDGFETCARLRRAASADLVVVALTGWGQREHRERTLQAGFDFHLVKPIAPGELLNRLHEVLSAPRRVDRQEPGADLRDV